MPLKGEDYIDNEIIAERTSILCKVAEESFEEMSKGENNLFRPVYVIGTDIPPPGGRTFIYKKVTEVDELKKA